jgi:hypothetical protein
MATMMSLTTRVSRGRESGKPFPAWIDVDDLIECADLGRTEQVGQVDEVAVQIGDATVVAGAVASSPPRRGRQREASTEVAPAVLAVRGHEPRRAVHYHSLLSSVGCEAGMQGRGGRVDCVLWDAGEQPLALR